MFIMFAWQSKLMVLQRGLEQGWLCSWLQHLGINPTSINPDPNHLIRAAPPGPDSRKFPTTLSPFLGMVEASEASS